MKVIYARNALGYIGKDSKLMYSFKEDMNFFKNKTMGNTLVFGYKSFLEIGKTLKDREVIVVVDKTRDFVEVSGITYVNSFSEAVEKYSQNPFGQLFICGGKTIYDEAFSNYSEDIRTIYETIVVDCSIGDTKLSQELESFFLNSFYKKTDLDRLTGKEKKLIFLEYLKGDF